MVIKMDFPVGWEEGMGKFPCCSIKAVVNERLQTVRVIDGVEACEKKAADVVCLAGQACPGHRHL